MSKVVAAAAGLMVAIAFAAPAHANGRPIAHAAATCDDYSNQAAAQRAKDTRDADGDGLYCETLPCPCSTGRGGSGGSDAGERRRKARARARAEARRRAARRRAARRRAAQRRRAQARRREERHRRQIKSSGFQIVEVVDGDTIKVEKRSGDARARYTVRLIGLDTPETRKPNVPVECGGREATSAMLSIAFTAPTDSDGDGLLDQEGGEGVRVSLTTDKSQDLVDSFDRLLAYVDVAAGMGTPVANGAGYDIGETIVGLGFSPVYVFEDNFARINRFSAAEEEAKATNRGVWGQCGGDFHSEQ